MLFIWGIKHREKALGVVADRCSGCGHVAKMSLSEHHKVGHLYYVPLGSGELVATSMKCSACGCELACNPRAYAQMVDATRADAMQLELLLQVTNPQLQRSLAARERLEGVANGEMPSGSLADAQSPMDPDLARLKLLVGDLRCLEGLAAADGLLVRLEAWPQLGTDERRALLREGHELLAEAQQYDEIVRFVSIMSKVHPGNAGEVLFWASVIGSLSAFLWLPPVRDWLWGSLLAVGGLVVATMMMGLVRDRAVLKWTRSTLGPRAMEAGIDFSMLVDLLSAWNASKDEIADKAVKELVADAATIARVLVDDGLLSMRMQQAPTVAPVFDDEHAMPSVPPPPAAMH